MKRLLRVFIIMALMMVSGMILPISASAATKTKPAKVENLQAASKESAISLTWNKVNKADGYNVYRVSANGTAKRVKRTRSNRCTIKGLTNGKTYTFYVRAYRESGTKLLEGKKSAKVKETPHIVVCGVPELELADYTGTKAYLEWKPVPYATEYVIFQRKTRADSYKIVGTTAKTKICIKKLKDQSFYFCIKARRTIGKKYALGYASNEIFVKSYKDVHTMYYAARVTRDLTAAQAVKSGDPDGSTSILERYSQTGGTVSIPAGTQVTVVKRSSGENVIMLDDGRMAFVNASYLNYQRSLYDDEIYPKQTAEMIVNMRGYTSRTPYLIWISLTNQTAYFFKGTIGQWEMIDYCRCTTGSYNSYSHQRFDYIARKENPGPYRNGASPFELGGWGPYACYFGSGSDAMHGWVYYDQACTMRQEGDFGEPISHGCIRIEERIMKDIWAATGKYSEGTLGTTVVIY